MKLFLGLLISFFFIALGTNQSFFAAVDGCFEADQKTSLRNTRAHSSQTLVQKKQLHPGSCDFNFIGLIATDFTNQDFCLIENSYQNVSNYVSSGAKISQHLASV